eukprot:CAMPEP_0184288354 /NCGR_PEP_ID=MMETSP1049-20130417/881_1 /TAXON_ID=77928 /ORGANISM="Proteomonas sulcata, Strain CCMP704" /LENGTH=212 /DNA_ID=CAMNT_0026594711 /DNA_START=279 /DNA_END=917 /DNA_ORIENTATION=+
MRNGREGLESLSVAKLRADGSWVCFLGIAGSGLHGSRLDSDGHGLQLLNLKVGRRLVRGGARQGVLLVSQLLVLWDDGMEEHRDKGANAVGGRHHDLEGVVDELGGGVGATLDQVVGDPLGDDGDTDANRKGGGHNEPAPAVGHDWAEDAQAGGDDVDEEESGHATENLKQEHQRGQPSLIWKEHRQRTARDNSSVEVDLYRGVQLQHRGKF